MLHAPRVTRIDVEYRYPGSLGLAPHIEEDGGDIFAPAGTEARLRVHVDQSLRLGLDWCWPMERPSSWPPQEDGPAPCSKAS